MKITKNILKQIIMEEIGGYKPNTSYNVDMRYEDSNQGRQWPGGRLDNQERPHYEGRPPYETIGAKLELENGQKVITIGKLKYELIFDNEELTSGHISPIGEYKFTINKQGDASNINWVSQTPPHVRFDSQLEKQILDYSGREQGD